MILFLCSSCKSNDIVLEEDPVIDPTPTPTPEVTNDPELAKAVEELFGVKVAKVNTISVRGKFRRQGWKGGYTAATKKAIVTLKAESKGIEFFESMY